MQIITTTNARELGQFMSVVFADQVAFALQKAVRQTMLDVQANQREHQRGIFTIRRKTFVDRAVKIRDWPTKQNPSGIVRIEPPGGAARAGILIDHEEGERRMPRPGHRGRLVEREVRPTPERIAPTRLRPRNLGLRKRTDSGERGFAVWHGQRRTFMIRRPGGGGAIFQRHARGKRGTFEGTRLLWAITPEGVKLEPTLDFHENAERIVGERWALNMADAWDRALLTAR